MANEHLRSVSIHMTENPQNIILSSSPQGNVTQCSLNHMIVNDLGGDYPYYQIQFGDAIDPNWHSSANMKAGCVHIPNISRSPIQIPIMFRGATIPGTTRVSIYRPGITPTLAVLGPAGAQLFIHYYFVPM